MALFAFAIIALLALAGVLIGGGLFVVCLVGLGGVAFARATTPAERSGKATALGFGLLFPAAALTGGIAGASVYTLWLLFVDGQHKHFEELDFGAPWPFVALAVGLAVVGSIANGLRVTLKGPKTPRAP